MNRRDQEAHNHAFKSAFEQMVLEDEKRQAYYNSGAHMKDWNSPDFGRTFQHRPTGIVVSGMLLKEPHYLNAWRRHDTFEETLEEIRKEFS